MHIKQTPFNKTLCTVHKLRFNLWFMCISFPVTLLSTRVFI